MSNTKREMELELALWNSRKETAVASMTALNLQAQMLKANGQEIETNIARLQKDLADINAVEEKPGAPEAQQTHAPGACASG